jgi:hypothetical protein
MPGGDRTGPRGMGPMTGRMSGWCAGASPGGSFEVSSERVNGFGRGRRRRDRCQAAGFTGLGRTGRGGFRAANFVSGSPQDELDYLKQYTLGLEEALDAVRARMSEIEKTKKTE